MYCCFAKLVPEQPERTTVIRLRIHVPRRSLRRCATGTSWQIPAQPSAPVREPVQSKGDPLLHERSDAPER